MPRENYMTIRVPDSIQAMFDDYVKIKEISKTAALNDVIEMYMLASDEELYLQLKKKYLNVESVKQMIADRDSNNFGSNDEEFIFMKLSNTSDMSGKEYDGNETMEVYIKDSNKRGYTWFSTQSLYYGMSEKRVKYFNEKIGDGKNIKILFAIGSKAGGINDIAYSADVLEIKSNKIPKSLPTNDYPEVWHGESARIWIKINNISVEKNINASMLKITSTGSDLNTVINSGQFHFGYVTYK